MMEKQGIVAPEITPPENADTAKVASVEKGRQEAIRELDSDFRKAASEATRKSLR